MKDNIVKGKVEEIGDMKTFGKMFSKSVKIEKLPYYSAVGFKEEDVEKIIEDVKVGEVVTLKLHQNMNKGKEYWNIIGVGDDQRTEEEVGGGEITDAETPNVQSMLKYISEAKSIIDKSFTDEYNATESASVLSLDVYAQVVTQIAIAFFNKESG